MLQRLYLINPPMNFKYKGKLHKLKKADGPERIEQEWWKKAGQLCDYYAVEDEEGYPLVAVSVRALG